jgi:cytochrome P450
MTANICPITSLSELYDLSNPQLEQTLNHARAESPVTWLPDIGYWAVSKYDDVKKILGDTENFSAEITLNPLEPFTDEVIALLKERNFCPRPTLSNNTREDHARIRRHTQIAFAPRRMKTLEPYIRELVDEAVGKFIDDKRADLVGQVVYELPALVLFRLLGVPPEDVAHIKQWADDRLLMTFGRLDPKRQLEAAKNLAEYWDYCLDLVQKKIAKPGDDLPSDMLATRAEDESALSLDDINNVVFGLLLAGHETTTNASANAILTLLQEEGAWAELAENPDLIPGAIEEILRFRPSVVAWRRLAKEPVEIAGVKIPAGDRVLCFLASANRDEDKFENSEVFDIHRKDARAHIAFGFGNHFCLGAPLARFELQVILEELTARLPGLRLADDQSLAMVETVQFRGPKELWVEWS